MLFLLNSIQLNYLSSLDNLLEDAYSNFQKDVDIFEIKQKHVNFTQQDSPHGRLLTCGLNSSVDDVVGS